MIVSKIVSSLEKAFINDTPDKFETLERISALKGERVSFQLLCYDDPSLDEKKHVFITHKVEVTGELSKYSRLREVKYVPVVKPVSIEHDENYISTKPGLYPDILSPMTRGCYFNASIEMMTSVWVDLDLPSGMSEVGESELTLTVTDTKNNLKVAECKLTVDIIDAILPEQKLLVTQWLSFNSLWRYHNVKPFGEEFYRILEENIRIAAKNGMNTLFLFAFLGTVKITRRNGEYSFSYKRLERVMAIAKKYGIRRFEVDHLFSAGNAEKASGVRIVENGEETVKFRGESATSPEYTKFLRAFLKSLIRYMKRKGEDKNLIFHIADEPAKDKIESFRAAKATVADILEGYMIIDALFDIEYYKEGLVTNPVPINGSIQPFLDAGVPDLWTYYCCGPQAKYSNRFISMYSAQNRSLGMQLYKYKLYGFLHWGFCYYMNESTSADLNPYLDNSGENWVSGGDTFLVYPTNHGEVLESLRLLVFHDALQDMRAMQLCESLYSHETVVSAIEEEFGGEVRFDTCAYDGRVILRIRERINEMIKKAIAK